MSRDRGRNGARSAPSSTAPASRSATAATSSSTGAPLSRPAGDPDHRRVRAQRRERGVRVGRLAVVDVARRPPTSATGSLRCRSGTNARSPAPDRRRGRPRGRGPARRRPARSRRCAGRPGATSRDAGRARAVAERAVDEHGRRRRRAGPGAGAPSVNETCRPGRGGQPAAPPPGRRRCRPRRCPRRPRSAPWPAAYASKPPCQSRWSGAEVEHRAPAAGRTDGAECSWKLDSSTASTSYGGSAVTASTTGSPTLPVATARSPAARSIDSSIRTVVVLPLVPVSASHGAGRAAQPPGQLDLADHLDAGRGGRGAAAARPAASPATTTSSRCRPAAPSAPSASVAPAARAPRSRRRRPVHHGDPGAEPQQRPRRRRPRAPAPATTTRARPRTAPPGRPAPAGPPRPSLAVTRQPVGDELGVEQAEPEGDGEPGDDPEPDDHRDLRPAGQLEVVVDRRHLEQPFAGAS